MAAAQALLSAAGFLKHNKKLLKKSTATEHAKSSSSTATEHFLYMFTDSVEYEEPSAKEENMLQAAMDESLPAAMDKSLAKAKIVAAAESGPETDAAAESRLPLDDAEFETVRYGTDVSLPGSGKLLAEEQRQAATERLDAMTKQMILKGQFPPRGVLTTPHFHKFISQTYWRQLFMKDPEIAVQSTAAVKPLKSALKCQQVIRKEHENVCNV